MPSVDELIAAEAAADYEEAQKVAARVAAKLNRPGQRDEVLNQLRDIVDADPAKAFKWNNRKANPEAWAQEEADLARQLSLGGRTPAELMRLSQREFDALLEDQGA